LDLPRAREKNLVALDGSDPSKHIQLYAVDFAEKWGAEVYEEELAARATLAQSLFYSEVGNASQKATLFLYAA
jgi:hypothetical protein